MADWRLAVDIGGTFTDVVLLDATTGNVVVEKTLSTPSRPLDGVRRGVTELLRKAAVEPVDVSQLLVHATTLITNALIEGKTAKAALVTTAGFGDTLLIRSEHRFDMYDLQIDFPAPPIGRDMTFEVDERTRVDGTVTRRPSETTISTLVDSLRATEAEAVAICLLHSYANGANERLVADAVAEQLGLPVSCSHEVAPQIREYPRMVTTACNAATMPIIGPYIDELADWLSDNGFAGSMLMMLSNGGVISAQDVRQVPIRMVESGPAAGALAASWYARRLDERRLLCFDMGGTTAKSCLIDDFEPHLTNEFEVARAYRNKKGSGYPLTTPSVDLVEIGAGGGSIARVDELGLLKVGPGSAGAEPGPASYGRGGQLPAVTDADLLLGYLDPSYFLGGDMPLDVEAAEAAMAKVAEGMGSTPLRTAAGVYEVVNQNMAAAARMHAIERGIDLRGVPLIAFGGAGPVHACGVAELLETERVFFPVDASVLSAFGTLVSPARIDLARSMVAPLDGAATARRDELIELMRADGRRVLRAAGVVDDRMRFRYGFDGRYRGQGNEISVWVGSGEQWPVSLDEAIEMFYSEYEHVYGMRIPGVPVEVVTWRLAALADPPELAVTPLKPSAEKPVATSTRSACFGTDAEPAQVPVYRRAGLGAGAVLTGPAIVEERETTIVIRPGWSAEVIADGSMVATRAGVSTTDRRTR